MANTQVSPILVELLDSIGAAIGVCEKLAAHRPPGVINRAFSIFLLNRENQLLLQRRALGKYHSPGPWANTCCGHPLPGESAENGARRRLRDELGLVGVHLFEAGVVQYRVSDSITGLGRV